MFKQLIPLLLICSYLAADPISSYSGDLSRSVAIVRQIPEAKPLLDAVEREGKITIRTARSKQFNAYWDSTHRQIIINNPNQRSTGSITRSILFELHNAKSNQQLINLYQKAERGQIDRASYVRQIERIEYENVRSCSKILDAAISRGLLPESARWTPLPTFEQHFAAQRRSGHSQYHARSYDRMSPLA